MISNDLNENSIIFNFLDRFFKMNNDSKMKFSLEIGSYDELETLPTLKDINIIFLPRENYKKTAEKAYDSNKKTA